MLIVARGSRAALRAQPHHRLDRSWQACPRASTERAPVRSAAGRISSAGRCGLWSSPICTSATAPERDVLRRPAPRSACSMRWTDDRPAGPPRRRRRTGTRAIRGGRWPLPSQSCGRVGERLGRPSARCSWCPGTTTRRLLRGWSADAGAGAAARRVGAARCLRQPGPDRRPGWRRRACASVTRACGLTRETYATHGHYLDRTCFPHAPIGASAVLAPTRGLQPRPAPGTTSAAHMERLRHSRTRAGTTRPGATGQAHVLNPVRAPSCSCGPGALGHGGSRRSPDAPDADAGATDRPGPTRLQARAGHLRPRPPAGTAGRRCPAPVAQLPRSRAVQHRLLDVRAVLVADIRPPHPYWPGGAILLEPGAIRGRSGLLDGLSHEELWSPRRLRSVT